MELVFFPFVANPNRTLPIARSELVSNWLPGGKQRSGNLAGGISRAWGTAENGRSAGIGYEECAIKIGEP
jgi:hypothetical protein